MPQPSHCVVYYEKDENNPASGFEAGAFIPKGRLKDLWSTFIAMRNARPKATICFKPVDKPPEWVDWET